MPFWAVRILEAGLRLLSAGILSRLLRLLRPSCARALASSRLYGFPPAVIPSYYGMNSNNERTPSMRGARFP